MKIIVDRDHLIICPPKPRADFTVQISIPLKYIRIIDQDLGNMSVTNDLEQVLLDVATRVIESLDNYSITYRDSTGTWDRIIVTPDETSAHTFNVEVRPGPRAPGEHRDPMATS